MFDMDKAEAEIIAAFAKLPKKTTGPTGPKTPAGKQRSRLNAYKHGLTGQIRIFTAEEHQAFDKHCQSTIEALAPIGNLEQQLAQSIAEDKWRLNLARALESSIFALGFLEDLPPDQPQPGQIQLDQGLSQAKTWLKEGNHLQLLSLYGQRIQRPIERNMAELRTLRAERRAARHEAGEEAILLSQLAKSKGETYQIPADFPSREFVFSRAEIELLMLRKQLLAEARALPQTRSNPNPGLQMPAAA